MPPKNTGMSKKTEKKIQDKIIEDKTFGLKNKNKSKVVQSYVKSVTSQVKGVNTKGGESKRLADEYAEKEAKKKDAEKQAFLSTLFKTVKKVQEEEVVEEEEVVVDDKYEDIDLYIDQREQIFKKKMEDGNADEDEDLKFWMANKGKTEKICKFFIEAAEASKYGWKWVCPNGFGCIYKHALPAGYTLKKDRPQEEKGDVGGILEENLELERAMLAEGTPVTFERFLKWKADKKAAKEKETEKKRAEEAKKTGTKGLNVLSGRALFTYDPTLFQDDAEALGNEEYEEEVIPEEEEEFKEGDSYEEVEIDDPEGKEWGVEGGAQTGPSEGVVSKKKKIRRKKVKAEDVQINEDVFLDGEDVELPEDDM